MAVDYKTNENGKSPNKRMFNCFRCGKIGHKANACKYKRQNSTKEQFKSDHISFVAYETADSFTASCNVADSNVNSLWILDSGCTSHLCNNENTFEILDITKETTLNLASHACADVKRKGEVLLCAKIVDDLNIIEIKNTLFVPELRSNLISIAKIVDKGYKVIFSKREAVVTDENGNNKLRADRRGNLFYLQLNEYCAAAEVKNIDVLRWLYRLGLVNANHMKRLVKAFKDYHNWAKNQFNNPVKFLQSDNGLEYINPEFDAYLNDNGIVRRTNIPHTHQQNGVAERYNRTIMDRVRCLFLQSNLSYSRWSSAVSAACYIRNRCSSNSLNGLSPYEKLFKR